MKSLRLEDEFLWTEVVKCGGISNIKNLAQNNYKIISGIVPSFCKSVLSR